MTNHKPNFKPKPKTNPKHKFKYVLIGLLCLSLILAVVFTVLPNFMVKDIPLNYNEYDYSTYIEYGIGIWRSYKDLGGPDAENLGCTLGPSSRGKPMCALSSKCNTNKAFSIIGIVANFVALILISFNMSENIAKLTTVLAFVSYLIIMAFFMSYKKDYYYFMCEINLISDEYADCSVLSDYDYGPGFILCAICTCLTLCSSIMI